MEQHGEYCNRAWCRNPGPTGRVAILRYLPDQPAHAAWLRPDERGWLMTTIAAQRSGGSSTGHIPLWRILVDPTVMVFSVIYFGRMMALFGVTFFLPLIFRGLGLTTALGSYTVGLYFLAIFVGAVAVLVAKLPRPGWATQPQHV